MEKLLDILREINSEIDYEHERQLIDERLYDSIQVVYLISALCSEFDIQIEPQDMVPDNFNSVEAMWELIQKYKG